MLTELRSLARTVTPIALDFYDKGDPSQLLDLIARRVPNPGNEKTGTLEWFAAYPELRIWVGEKTVQKAFAGAMTWSSEAWEVTLEFNKHDAARASSLVKVNDMAQRIVSAVLRGKAKYAMRPLRENVLAYDGQSFFDTDHVHPDGTTYSNLATVDRDDDANPTIGEARAELKEAMYRLMANRVIREGISLAPTADKNLIVIAKSQGVWQGYQDLLTEERIGGDPNRFRGTFTLALDRAPKAGTENAVDFLWADPEGPRPVAVIDTREPNGVYFDESKVFSHQLIPFGMDGEIAVAPAFPQAAFRVQP